jgi:hypothetical protein
VSKRKDDIKAPAEPEDKEADHKPDPPKLPTTSVASAGHRIRLPPRTEVLYFVDEFKSSGAEFDYDTMGDKLQAYLARKGQNITMAHIWALPAACAEMWERPELTHRDPPFPEYGPSSRRCRTAKGCAGVSVAMVWNKNNKNGDAGRVYYECKTCKRFVTWADRKGMGDNTGSCRCGEEVSCRKYINEMDGTARLECWDGRCSFLVYLPGNNHSYESS